MHRDEEHLLFSICPVISTMYMGSVFCVQTAINPLAKSYRFCVAAEVRDDDVRASLSHDWSTLMNR
jgi:hypothetical protein